MNIVKKEINKGVGWCRIGWKTKATILFRDGLIQWFLFHLPDTFNIPFPWQFLSQARGEKVEEFLCLTPMYKHERGRKRLSPRNSPKSRNGKEHMWLPFSPSCSQPLFQFHHSKFPTKHIPQTVFGKEHVRLKVSSLGQQDGVLRLMSSGREKNWGSV